MIGGCFFSQKIKEVYKVSKNITGTVREKKGLYYAVVNYYGENEERKQKWFPTVPSQQKWTQKSLKKRNESQYFLGLRKLAAFIPRFT